MATLYLVRGYPGSGKSTFARNQFPGILHLENDMFMMDSGEYKWTPLKLNKAIEICGLFVKTALLHNADVVISNTFTKCKFIEFYKKVAETYSADFKVYRCIGNFKNIHGLNSEQLKGFKKSMEDYPDEIIIDPNDKNNLLS